jgi:NADPH:quinone reductase
MFRDAGALPVNVNRVFVLGRAGRVGSLAIQLLKAFVIATASRPASRAWCKGMRSDLVVDHAGDVVAQLASAGIDAVDMVLTTANSPGWVSGAWSFSSV